MWSYEFAPFNGERQSEYVTFLPSPRLTTAICLTQAPNRHSEQTNRLLGIRSRRNAPRAISGAMRGQVWEGVSARKKKRK